MRNDSLPARSKSYPSPSNVSAQPNRIIITPTSGSASGHTLSLLITSDDVCFSDRSGMRNPILCALQRQTKSLWRLYDDGFALEAMPPYRACQLPEDAVEKWKVWQATGEMECQEWEVELVSNQARDGHSFIQRRHTTMRRKPKECEEDQGAKLSQN